MKLFSKRKESNLETKSNALTKGMQVGYTWIQERWANWMKRRTKDFSHRTWVVLLILFMLSTSTYSVYWAVNAIITGGRNVISITPIREPEHVTETGEAHIEAAEISEAAHIRIKKFRLYMDSLARSPSGKIRYDSITGRRPGLMDSVRFLENYFQQLKQK